jgi:PAS domain S-box-containing protein
MSKSNEITDLEKSQLETLPQLKEALEDAQRARDELKANRKLLEEAQRIGKMGSWFWDGKSDKALCSRESFRLFGIPYDPEGIKVEEFYNSVHPDDRARVNEAMEVSLREGSLFNETYRVILSDGSELIHNDQAEIKLNGLGEPEMVIGIHHDITDLHRANIALEKSEKMSRSILQTSLDGFQRTDLKGKFLEVNRAFCHMVGYEENELLTMGLIDIVSHPSQDKISQRLEDIKKAGHKQFESVLRRRDGSFVMVELIVQYREEEEQFVCFSKDITERKQIEEQLEQAKKLEALGSLAGGIAHDFNNLLTPVMGMAQLLMEELPEESAPWFKAKEIYRASNRGANLVRQILAFSRSSNRTVNVIPLLPIVEEVADLLRSSVPDGVILTLVLDSTCGLVKADPTQIHQTLLNIVTNAFHAMKNRTGEIRLVLKEVRLTEKDLPSPSLVPGRWAQLSIADEGSGIPEMLREKIFDPYFTTRGLGTGTGLGLAVVSGIINDHGGAITVESEEGEGTVFHVWLPVTEE